MEPNAINTSVTVVQTGDSATAVVFSKTESNNAVQTVHVVPTVIETDNASASVTPKSTPSYLDGFFSTGSADTAAPVVLESGDVMVPSGPTFSQLLQSVMLPSRVAASAFRIPFRIAMKGRRLPSWSTQMEIVVAAFRSACRNAPRDLSMLRSWTDIAIPSLLLPDGAVFHTTSIRGLSVDWVFPHSFTESMQHPKGKRRISSSVFSNENVLEWSKTHPVVLYLHGGAFCLCGSNTHRNIISSFAMHDLVLFAPNYRRPPDVSIIEAVDDCLAAYKYLVDVVGVDPKRISVMGDSAGGSLSILMLCRIRDENKSLLPSSIVLLSPWCDLDDQEIRAEADNGVIMPPHDYLPLDAIVLISKWVVGNHSPTDPRINPFWADLEGLPKILIHAGGVEVLFNQIARFYDKCKETHGINVKMKVWADMPHVPHTFTHVSETAVMAVEDAANFIKDSVDPPVIHS